jgi:hypothetical protein
MMSRLVKHKDNLALPLPYYRCKVLKCRKYDKKHLSSGFTNINVDEENRPQCLFCMKILATDNIKQNKLWEHLETVHGGECVGKKHMKFSTGN